MEIENKEGEVIEVAEEGAVNIGDWEKHREDPEANPDPSGQEAAEKTPAEEPAKVAAPAEPEEKVSEAALDVPAESADLSEKSGDPEEEQEGAVEEGEKKEKPKETRRDRRINRLTRERREAEERADAAEAQLAARPEEIPAGPEEIPAPAEKPKQDDFDEFDKYLDARDAYNKKEWEAERREESAQVAEQDAEQVRRKRWAKGADVVKAANDDYDKVIEDSDFTVTAAMHDALQASDQGPAVFFHLCRNQEEADKISAMNPVAATLAIGRLASTIATPAAPAATSPNSKQSKPVSRAPAPGKKITGAHTSTDKDPSDMTPLEYEKHRLAGRSYGEL